MSEYSQSHSDQKLLGAPPGNVGYEAGCQLTNAVKAKPFSILLFDEIEKADSTILDKFLQILEDGRMTDSKGETINYSNTLIIFKSNLGVSRIDKKTGERIYTIKFEDDNSDYEAYRNKILLNINDYFDNVAGRPEIRNRIGDNFIIFEFIKHEVAEKIAKNQLKKIKANLEKDRNIKIVLGEAAEKTLVDQIHKNLSMGGRGVGNTIEKILINPLARVFADVKKSGDFTLVINDFIISETNASLDYALENESSSTKQISE